MSSYVSGKWLRMGAAVVAALDHSPVAEKVLKEKDKKNWEH